MSFIKFYIIRQVSDSLSHGEIHKEEMANFNKKFGITKKQCFELLAFVLHDNVIDKLYYTCAI